MFGARASLLMIAVKDDALGQSQRVVSSPAKETSNG